MSETAKAAKFPAACANRTCAQPLSGPVNHCPFCGVSVQRAAPALRVVPPVPVPVPSAAAPVAAPVVSAPAPAQPQPAPVVTPPPAAAAPAPVPEAGKPKRKMSKIWLVVVAVLAFGAYKLQQLGSEKDKQQIEQALSAGKTCMNKKDYRCAIENADVALQKDRNEPRALSLKQQAQNDLARVQKAEDEKQARLQAEAQRKADAEQARQEQARVRAEQAEADARRRTEEQDRRAQELREQRADEQRQQELRAQEQQRVRDQRAQERAAQQQQRRSNDSGNYVAPQNVFNRPNSFNTGSSTDDIIRQGQQMQQFQRQQQQQQRPVQGQQQQNKDVIRSIIQ